MRAETPATTQNTQASGAPTSLPPRSGQPSPPPSSPPRLGGLFMMDDHRLGIADQYDQSVGSADNRSSDTVADWQQPTESSPVINTRTAMMLRKSIVGIIIVSILILVYLAWSRSSNAGQLVDAARKCETERLKSLLESGVSPNVPAVSWKGWSVGEPYRQKDYALSVAASEGCVEGIELLYANGALLESEDSEGMTALALAARWSQPTAVGWLLENDADFRHADEAGNTSLHWAAGYGDPESVRLLLSSGAQARRSNLYGNTPKKLANMRLNKVGQEIVLILDEFPLGRP